MRAGSGDGRWRADFANDVGEATADALDGGERVHDGALAVEVGVEDAHNVVELVPLLDEWGELGRGLDLGITSPQA